MVKNANDPRQVDRGRERSKADDRLCDQILREIMQTPRGRRYIWLDLEAHKVFRQTLVLRGDNAFAATAYQEGQRSMGLKLIDDVTRLVPELYLLMTRENSGVTLEDEDERSPDADT